MKSATGTTTTKSKGAMVRAKPKTICTIVTQTRPLEYIDGAIRVTSSAFYSNHVAAGEPIL